MSLYEKLENKLSHQYYKGIKNANGQKGNGVVDDEVGHDPDSPDLLNKAQRLLREALSKNFIKKEAIRIALENGIQLCTLHNIWTSIMHLDY